MWDHLDTVQELWAGKSVKFDGPKGPVDVRTLPKPIQKKLPVWITTAGNEETYRLAGKKGCHILTHLLGQTIEDVQAKSAMYREEWNKAGHAGNGQVTLMLHTFVGEDRKSVRSIVHEPMKQYLKSAMFLVKSAAWNFPTFKKVSEESGTSLDEYFDNMGDDELDSLLDFAFERYFETSGLFGSVAEAAAMIDKCKSYGIDEVACLIDFGVDDQSVLDHLPYLAEVLRAACVPVDRVDSSNTMETHEDYSMGAQISEHKVSHLQCTPSMASLLLADPVSKESLSGLQHFMVGGEALSDQLAKELASAVNGKVTNMYGPTETTIWSSVSDVKAGTNKVTIGHPIANTQIYIVDKSTELMPPGVPGELVIGGNGVVRGYHKRPELTGEKFIKSPFSENSHNRLYRTGDLAKYEQDGSITYLGRIDDQIKLNGYRIELGEIEETLRLLPEINQVVVTVSQDSSTNRRLIAYFTPATNDSSELSKSVDVEALRSVLTEKLPSFMVPSVFVTLDVLPLTPNGKIDRNSLPKPEATRRAIADEAVLPKSDIEKTIADCWSESIGISHIGRDENFFDIGGNSILLLDVLVRINKCVDISCRLKVTDVFRYSTIASLSEYVEKQSEGARTVENEGVLDQGRARASSRKAALLRKRRKHSSNPSPVNNS